MIIIRDYEVKVKSCTPHILPKYESCLKGHKKYQSFSEQASVEEICQHVHICTYSAPVFRCPHCGTEMKYRRKEVRAMEMVDAEFPDFYILEIHECPHCAKSAQRNWKETPVLEKPFQHYHVILPDIFIPHKHFGEECIQECVEAAELSGDLGERYGHPASKTRLEWILWLKVNENKLNAHAAMFNAHVAMFEKFKKVSEYIHGTKCMKWLINLVMCVYWNGDKCQAVYL